MDSLTVLSGEIDMAFDSIKSAYFEETAEILSDMEKYLLILEDNPDDADSVNALFRAVHTIKGSSGMFGFNDISSFTHSAENLMDKIRLGQMKFSQSSAALLLKVHDIVGKMTAAYGTDSQPDATLRREADEVVNEIRMELDGQVAAKLPSGDTSAQKPPAAENSDDSSVQNVYWHISLRPKPDIFTHGYDPYSFIRFLQNKGRIVNLKIVKDKIPSFELMDPEKCYISYEILFDSDSGKTEISSVFEFISDDCDIFILPPHSKFADYKSILSDLIPDSSRMGSILTEIGALTPKELNLILEQQKNQPEDGPKFGEIAISNRAVDPEIVGAVLEKQKALGSNFRTKSMRIDADKLDVLINLVGELVISGASAAQISHGSDEKKEDFSEKINQMNRLIDEVRNSVLNLRMIKIGEVFSRFKRTVRDLSRELGKEVELIIEGGDTELDKTIVEKISDPIMHIIRNSADHGIGSPDERLRSGKNPSGTIRLNAYHETGSIVVEISDDGEGLNSAKILAKAVEKGLVRDGESLSSNEIFNLIFEPGFSTAEKVTNVSGRGVGMDVVKRNIESLRGNVSVFSEAGAGTIVKIQLPLTLSIIDGFRVLVAGKSYVIPLDLVIECIEIDHEKLFAKDGGNFLDLRGEVLPFVYLRDFFREGGNSERLENVVIVEYGSRKAGIVVDSLMGEFQTVIKPLGKIYKKVSWLSGATILGNGDISLILDVPRLISGSSRS